MHTELKVLASSSVDWAFAVLEHSLSMLCNGQCMSG
jgi:hypothetical protein